MRRSHGIDTLLGPLLRGTRDKSLTWRRAEKSGLYKLLLDTGSITIAKHPSADAYAMVVHDLDGLAVEETGGFIPRPDLPELAEMYDLAHESAADRVAAVEAILASVLRKVQGDKKAPTEPK